MSNLRAEIETARWRIDHSDMNSFDKMLAHGLINAHILMAREWVKSRSTSRARES